MMKSIDQPGVREREGLSAAVLAGGKSQRMGSDKALMSLVAGGPALLSLVLARLETVSNDVFIVANDYDRYDQFGYRVVADVHADAGPLGGIHSAVSKARQQHTLVVACDMPFLNRGLLQRMAEEPRDYDVLVPEIPGESRQGRGEMVYQTLHAIYGRTCQSVIEERIASGARQVMGLFEDVQVRTIDLSEVLHFDPELLSFFNANTPEALHAASKIVAGEGRLTGE
ncbi:MAG: molybdenum cofactor guanylyltransferase [Chloroflexota bacterium]|nr:molybdenum cofactor guanylyltransferase [Chloroflexota bacterium]